MLKEKLSEAEIQDLDLIIKRSWSFLQKCLYIQLTTIIQTVSHMREKN